MFVLSLSTEKFTTRLYIMASFMNSFISFDTACTTYFVCTTDAHTLMLLNGQSFFTAKDSISTRKQIAILPADGHLAIIQSEPLQVAPLHGSCHSQ